MEYVKFQSAKDCAKIDQMKVSTSSTYVESNSFQYYLVINTWLDIVQHIAGSNASDALRYSIQINGLLAVIDACNTDANSLCHGDHELSGLGTVMCTGLNYAEALQVLRFPKRFSPVEADVLLAESKRQFLNVLNQDKLLSRSERHMRIISDLRDVLTPILSRVNLSEYELDGYFSSGAVANASRSHVSKANAWGLPYFLDILYPMGVKVENYHEEYLHGIVWNPTSWSRVALFPNCKTAKVVAVPKSYKSARIIAEEESTRQWMQQGIRSRLEQAILASGAKEYIPLEHQEHQQVKALLGAAGGGYATIDLSAASDHIPWALIQRIFPLPIWREMEKWRSSTILIDDKCYVSSIAFTSGSALCFVVESLVFWGIAQLATDYYVLFSGDDEVLPPSSYGDDIIVDDKAATLCMELLSILGFEVNTGKSFAGEHPYRESCGVEFMGGQECTSLYWPRKEITNSLSSIPSLIELHNKLFLRGWVPHTLRESIISLQKKHKIPTTLSAPDAALDGDPGDLIGYFDAGMKRKAPYQRAKEDPHDGERFNSVHYIVSTHPGRPDRETFKYETFLYVEYLRYGPMYEDALSELLHVSSSRRSRSRASSNVEFGVQAIADI